MTHLINSGTAAAIVLTRPTGHQPVNQPIKPPVTTRKIDMNPLQTLVIASALSLVTTSVNAQVCENGICRLPNPGQQQGNSNTTGYGFNDRYSAPQIAAPSTSWNGNSPADNWLRQSASGSVSPGVSNRPAYDNNRNQLLNGFSNQQRQPGAGTGRNSATLPSCRECGCKGDYCTCGPNCPSHYETSNLYRNTRQAPEPVSNRFQAASYASTIPWLSNYETALAESRRTGRPVLVRVTAEWCGACKQMKNQTFSDASIIRGISTGFIPVDIDADADRKLIELMGVRSLPSLLVITPDLRIVERIEGFRTAQQLSASLMRHTQRAQLETDVKIAAR